MKLRCRKPRSLVMVVSLMATVRVPLHHKVLHTAAILRKGLRRDPRKTGITHLVRQQTKAMATHLRTDLSLL